MSSIEAVPRWAWWLVFGVGSLLVVAQAFLPLGEFVHRGDDAFYYFKVAANYPRLGYWSFDGVEPTNGVQPLWAILLSAIAAAAAGFGVTDPELLARLFVLAAAAFHVLGGVLLYVLLARKVSWSTGLAAAGAWMFSAGFVWGRLWGMETPVLAVALLATLSWYELRFRPRPDLRGAVALGALLGLVCLSRLNAGLFIPVLLGAFVVTPGPVGFAGRLRLAVAAGLTASAVVAPYLAWNLASTGALMPISGTVKAIGVEAALREWVDGEHVSLFKRGSFTFYTWLDPVRWFISSRLLDGLWITGARFIWTESTPWATLLAVFAAVAAAPAAFGLAAWRRRLAARFGALAIFWPLGLFAVLDAIVTVAVYPTQTYAIPRWWLASAEIMLIVIAATLAAAAVEQISSRLPSDQARLGALAAGLTALVAIQTWQTVSFHWSGVTMRPDWSRSWNDESLAAARWMNGHLPPDAVVGSWNAGIVGYYTRREVVNLDGLINNANILPYLVERRIDRYILSRRIGYLSDMDPSDEFASYLHGRLKLTPVYRSYSPLMKMDYVVYRVDGPRTEQPTAAPGDNGLRP